MCFKTSALEFPNRKWLLFGNLKIKHNNLIVQIVNSCDNDRIIWIRQTSERRDRIALDNRNIRRIQNWENIDLSHSLCNLPVAQTTGRRKRKSHVYRHRRHFQTREVVRNRSILPFYIVFNLLAERYGLDGNLVLDNVVYARAHNCDLQNKLLL